MHKSLLILSLVGLMGSSVSARTLSPSEALSRALSTTTESGRAHRAPVQKTPVMTVGEASAPALYVFDQGNEGYLVVSADDVAAPILGYSTTGTFDPNNIPENMRWWLGQYKLEIEAAAKASAQSYYRAAEDTRQPIEPLIKTTWNQGEPYNCEAPYYLDGEQCVTGCVATAMAQVMNYHKWPKEFKADFAYKWGKVGTNLIWNDPKVVLDWDNMLDSYNNGYTPAQKTAVGTLMKACGYSVNMNYSSDQSGANSLLITEALVNTFNYDKGLRNAFRQFYSLTDWENLLYDEVKASRPILLSGSNSEGGHSFVCDGYQQGGYFHINWGWGGSSDSYFLLSALNPAAQGIGGSTSGYNLNQQAIIGIQPATTDSKESIVILCDGTFDVSTSETSNNSLYLNGPFYNFSATTVIGTIGIRFVSKDGTIVKESFYGQNLTFEIGGGYNLSVNCSVPEGSYYVYPVFKTVNGTVSVISCPADQAGYVEITRKGNNVTITTPSIGTYSVNDINFLTPFYAGMPFSVSGKAKWTGNISVSTPLIGVVKTSASKQANDILAHGSEMALEFLPDGEVIDFEYVSEQLFNEEETPVTMQPGNYWFAMAIKDTSSPSGYKVISEPIEVSYLKNPGTTSITIKNLVIKDANAVNPNDIEVSIRIQCTSGYFFNHMVVVFWSETNENVAQFSTNKVAIESGHSGDLIGHGIISNAKPGDKYTVNIYMPTSSRPENIVRQFTIGDYTAIDDISADAVRGVSASPNPASDYTVITASSDIQRVDLAAVSGRFVNVPVEIEGASARVDVSALTSGLYIARVITEAGVESVKIIKK